MSVSLARTQELFWQLITAPEGAASGLAALPDSDRGAAANLIRGDDRLDPTERCDIYAGMYFFRILDVLKEDFPALLAVIGDDNFHNLITDYLLVEPSRHFSLRFAGERLPDFVAEHALSQRWSYLGDLARFEWAMHDAFDAADAEPIGTADLAAITGEDWPALRFRVTPSLRTLALQYPVVALWRAMRDGE